MASDSRRGSLPASLDERVPAPLRDRIPDPVVQYVVALWSVARLGRFASVGAVGAVCDNLVLAGLVETDLLAPVAGAVVAKEVSIAVMFALNEVWTFSEAGSGGGPLRRFLTSNAVRGGGAVVGIAVLYALTAWLGVWYLLANVVGIGVGFALNYTAETLVTWRVHRG